MFVSTIQVDRRDVMLNQASLPRTGPVIDVAEVVAALRHGLLTLTGLSRPTRRFAPARAASYLEDGLMKRELHRL
jgi:hypothetical protein